MRDLGGHGSERRPPAPGSRRPGGPGRHGTNGHAHRPGPGYPIDTGPVSPDEDGHIDLVELQADDELINALSSGLGVSGPGQQGYDADDRLVAMLASWKADVDAEPMPQLVEPDVAAGLLAPHTKGRRRVSYLRPIAAAVAVAACGLGVLSIGAYEAQPGDTLWGVTKVFYGEHAEQVQAAADIRSGIERVNRKLSSGDTVGAQQDLDALGPLLTKVEPGQEQLLLDKQRQFLAAKVAETPPGTPTDPAAPLRDGTQAPVPEGSADPGTAPAPQQPAGPAGPAEPGGQPGTGGTSVDPRLVPAPEGTAPGTGETVPTTAPAPPPEQTSPTTEGSIDPTTTTRPTASGDSPTSNGGVSSTPS